MKLSRRTPPPDPADRLHALSRLHAATPSGPRETAAPVAETAGATDSEGDDEVRGGWIPDSVPERLRGSRWTLAPRHLVVIAVILLVGLVWGGCSVFRARPETVPESRPSSAIVSGSPVAGPSSPSTATVVVHVAGKVRRPGLIRVKSGSRVADVLAAAGGALPGVDLSSLNLARPVTDGEQIVVGVPTTAVPTGAPQPAGPGTTSPLDLNSATLAQLETLPGVGPVLAQRILAWRTEHGRFTTTDELQEVPGVGPKKFESLKPHVRV
ncbi:ComEA family DNA-binding protein [Kribbella sancticallisti]|uniref:ComEA family DNA-binding protein n=1 Tax=Kribbella sancticallisti TaxID=460087 RepID=A0ABN2E7F7_9ACTN